MTEGMKNTVVGVLLAAALGAVGVLLTTQSENATHFTKLDSLMETNHNILVELKGQIGVVPPATEMKLDELRLRINLHESRINEIEKRHP
jgi:hypothetical protein